MSLARATAGHRYLAWTGLSQTVNAGTNLLLTLQLARVLSTEDFSRIALCLALLALGIAGMRGYVYEPAVVHGDLSRTSSIRVLIDSATAGSGIGMMMAVVMSVLDGPMSATAVVAVGTVGAVVQDGARWMMIGSNRPAAAAGLDVVWLTVQLGGLALAGGSAVGLAATWTGGALVSGAVGWGLIRRFAEPRGATSTRVWQWGLEYVIASGGLQLAVLIAPITGGIGVAGGLRGAASVLGVATVLLGSAQQAVVGRLRHRPGGSTLRDLGLRLGVALGILVAIFSVPMLFLSDQLGEGLLGDTWPATRAALPFLALQRVLGAVAAGPSFVLRRYLGQTSGVWWRGLLTLAMLGGVLVGAAIAGEAGASAALAGGAAISIPVWIWMLRTATDRVEHMQPETGP